MSQRNRIYVGQLSSRTRERDLEDEFSRFGRINRVDLKFGYGFIVRVKNLLSALSVSLVTLLLFAGI